MNTVTRRTNKRFGIFLKATALLGVGFLVAAAYFYFDAIRDEALNLRPLTLTVFSDTWDDQNSGIQG